MSSPSALCGLQVFEQAALGWQALETEAVEPATELWSDPLPSSIRLDESKVARVGVPLPGRVTRVFVELGREVKKGDPLFSVASAELAMLHIERRRAELDRESAEANLRRIADLAAAHALSERAMLDARREYEQAELTALTAVSKQNSLSVGTLSGHEFLVRAPRAGRIIEKSILPGQQLAARSAQTLLTIADLSTVWLIADLFQADASALRIGSPVTVTVSALPDTPIAALVTTVSAIVDPERRTVAVRAILDNPSGVLKLNMFARARFLLQPRANSTVIRASAVHSSGSDSYVYVRGSDGHFTRRAITLASVVQNKAVIHAGLSADEAVATQGVTLLDNQLESMR
ncbi:MAG: efflux RND transporter periplasmic adaptor subunit [Polyangiaceae bacterium]